jgi:hypothetical protein
MLDRNSAKEFKTFLKKNKIKWSNPDDLMKVADFLKDIE